METAATTTVRTHESTGVIKWPTHLRDSGEGGMWVLAVVADDYAHAGDKYLESAQRAFEKCHVDTLPVLALPNAMHEDDPNAGDPYTHCRHCGLDSRWDYETSLPPTLCVHCQTPLPEDGSGYFQRFPLQERLWPQLRERESGTYDYEGGSYSRHFLACVCLGTSSGTWLSADHNHYHFTRADLTPAGESLVAALESLYGRKVEILTDT
jgi:hypothetical protein